MLFRQRAQALGARPRDGFGAVELGGVLVLAEVGAVVQLLQQDQLRALSCRISDALLDDGQVLAGIAMIRFLNQSGFDG